MTSHQKRVSVLNLAALAAIVLPPDENSRLRLVEVEPPTPAELARSMGLGAVRPYSAAIVLPGGCTGCASPDCKHHGARARKLARRAARAARSS